MEKLYSNSAVVVPQSKSTELCSSSAAVVACVSGRRLEVVGTPSPLACLPRARLPESTSTEMRLFILTCDIFGTRQTNILALRYLFEKTYKPAPSSAPQVTEINKLDQITENWLLT